MKTFNHLPPFDIPEIEQINSEAGRLYRVPYKPDSDIFYPSITTVLGWHQEKKLKDILNAWKERVGEEEAKRHTRSALLKGKRLHDLFEKYLKNDPNFRRGVFPDMLEIFQKTKPILDRIDNIRCLETQLYSHKLGVAGTTDCIADFDNLVSIIDYKTAGYAKPKEEIENYFEQETAYAEMWEERTGEKVDQVVIIMAANDSPDVKVYVEKKDKYIDSLQKKITQYKEK
jgi:hypothetical protein